MPRTTSDSFSKVLGEAVRYFATHGYVEVAELDKWRMRLQGALGRTAPLDRERLRKALGGQLARALTPTALARSHPRANRYTVGQVAPELRAELTRRVEASAELIRLNRERRIAETLNRFSGWATAQSGQRRAKTAEIIASVRQPVNDLSFEARRVEIDQGHKLIASVNAVIATQEGSIAGMWVDHAAADKTYNGRPEHVARTGKIYVIRGSWADVGGLIKHPNGYMDQIDMVGELPFCRCYYRYYNTLGALPLPMLTAAGKRALLERREE